MSYTQKIETLFQIVSIADEELTQSLTAIASQRNTDNSSPSTEDVAFFEKRRDDFFASGEKGLTKDESMEMLRNRLK